MAKSRFEYVKNFELNPLLLPATWIVARIDGNSFSKFANNHNFIKPNDVRALSLMNESAAFVCRQMSEIVMVYGQSDEYSFVLPKNCNLYKRRIEKILSIIVSTFTSAYLFN